MTLKQRKLHTFPLNVLIEASERYEGFCLSCGAVRGECEPDAQYYECDDCGENRVFGASEIIMMELIDD